MTPIKTIFQSSLDPNKVSLTITSISKFVTFLVLTYAVSKGFDPNTATTGVQQVTDIILSAVPACFAIWHAGEAIYGLIRKFFVVAPVVPTV